MVQKWIARAAFELGARKWRPGDARRILRVLYELQAAKEVECRWESKLRTGRIDEIALSFRVLRSEWRLVPAPTNAVAGAAGMTLEGYVRSWLEGRGHRPDRPLRACERNEIEGRLRLLFPVSVETKGRGSAWSRDGLFSIHPYGDEWLWAEDGESPKLVGWDPEAIRAIAATHRAGMIRTATEQGHDFFSDMHFILRRYTPGDQDPVSEDIAALVTADDEVIPRDDPRFVDAWEAIVGDRSGGSS